MIFKKKKYSKTLCNHSHLTLSHHFNSDVTVQTTELPRASTFAFEKVEERGCPD